MRLPNPAPDLSRIIRAFDAMPHCQLLGMKLVELRHGRGVMNLTYDQKLIGNPQSRVVHGGAITALLDTLSGAVVLASIPENTSVTTLDLRIDYLHAAIPEKHIGASVECYKVTANIAFVRGLAYHASVADPIAHCTGTFMLGASGFVLTDVSQNTQGSQPC